MCSNDSSLGGIVEVSHGSVMWPGMVDLLEVEDGVFFKTAALLVGVTRNVVNNLVVCCLADGRTVSSD